MKPIDGEALTNHSDWELITVFKPPKIDIEDYEKRDIYKKNQAYYFIAGTLKPSIRKDKNLIEKNLLTFDYENLDMEFEEFKKVIHDKLADYNYFLYPSIHSYHKGIKDKNDGSHIVDIDKGFRYRLVIDTNRTYTKEENASLVKNVGKYIGLSYDDKSETYSQCMGLPIITPYTDQTMFFKNYGKPFPIDSYIDKSKRNNNSKRMFLKANYKMKQKNYIASILEEWNTGIDEGQRNEWLTKQVGKMFYWKMDVESIENWIHILNENFISPPLNKKEVDTIFGSILKRELAKKGGN